MTRSTDFAARAHSLWRVRMARLQERLRFFWQLLLVCTDVARSSGRSSLCLATRGKLRCNVSGAKGSI